jgi:hypothetical protein
VLETGRRWRLVGAGDWEALETGRRWRLVGVGEWQALENGSRRRMVVAGEWSWGEPKLEAGRPSLYT